MKGKASSLFRVAQQGRGPLIKLHVVSDLACICAKCGKGANLSGRVVRRTKSGTYYYIQFRHRDNRKKGRYLYHYYRVEE